MRLISARVVVCSIIGAHHLHLSLPHCTSCRARIVWLDALAMNRTQMILAGLNAAAGAVLLWCPPVNKVATTVRPHQLLPCLSLKLFFTAAHQWPDVVLLRPAHLTVKVIIYWEHFIHKFDYRDPLLSHEINQAQLNYITVTFLHKYTYSK